MLRLMLLGLAAGMFFSTTFILNRVMSLEGGHWYWSAALRYAYMIAFLGAGLRACKGDEYFGRILSEFKRNALFWVVSGTIGFGGFYALICFAADYKIWIYAAVVFCGVFLVNISQVETANITTLLLGASPVLVAAFLYPLGNQLVWEAKQGRKGLPELDVALLDNAFAKVFLLSIGSVPFWLLLYPFTSATIPTQGQFINVALVALFSGVIATSLFLSARNGADNASKLAAVDATQSSEVIFALAGETLLLQASLPNATAGLGILIACAGLIAFVLHEHN